MKDKKIELKDITSNPIFVIGFMSFVCAFIMAIMVTLIMHVNTTKEAIVDARKLYEENVREVALLEELKIKSEAAQEQLEACKNILPDSLGDVFVLQEEVLEKCKLFGLKVLSIEQSVAVNETQEVVFRITATTSYRNLYDIMNYYTNLEQVHRFDSLDLMRNSDGLYTATFNLVFLAEQGAEGAVQAVVDGVVQEATS